MTKVNCIGSVLNRIADLTSRCLLHIVLSVASPQLALHELCLVEVQGSETQAGSIWEFCVLKCAWVRDNLEKWEHRLLSRWATSLMPLKFDGFHYIF